MLILLQVAIGLLVLGAIALLLTNLQVNLLRRGLELSFNWLGEPARFPLSRGLLPYRTEDSYAWAFVVGLVNSLQVVVAGLVLATILGVVGGAANFSSNWLLRQLAGLYVAVARNVPPLLHLLFWYFVVFLGVPAARGGVDAVAGLLRLPVSVEFVALLIGLTVYTGAYISEVVRGGINSVPRGQWEAARSLGFGEGRTLRLIILPQALRAILPGLNSQYINLAKNSTLAIAVGYSDIFSIVNTTFNQTGRSIEAFALLVLVFLAVDLLISGVMNVLNRLVLRHG
ncbi:MAG: ABC transporter permease subunit [Synechococcus sp. SB0668_bin_15]|nr:ABC transporter permease subunit [Synechococcus sp. SB0668_bin_15]MXZ83768.1 ABC transporter permease subunit [Synechococcus sp. SB0666_bin_14]MYA91374.1 ABC transporter permease subunit [Synechococcus sp. SB0663_bin_10]MYC50093.1 ABC transporter permease subunit [Synechococcus sp. SB0662_bin_14]MYG46445.1 ABC transporter permease subunit [Synechococcus sp. SB0675_bin_6]MYK92281.1 ABC transporter permease subunit [Synechococcus sp. SB0669_bin_8]